jgi:hypothetical protein
MNTTTRTLMAVPLAVAALSAGTAPATAETPEYVSNLDIVQPDPEPEPEPDPIPDGPADKVGPAGDPDPDPDPQDGPDDKDGPNNDPGPDGPDDFDGPNHDDDDDGDNDDGDNDDGDNDDNDVKRPTRVDAGTATDEGLSIAWVLASGAVITAAGGFTARRAALKRR